MTSPGHILIVDDNDLNRELLCRRLKQQGHTFAVARNGKEAMTQVAVQAFDVVLLDIMMPEMNGYEVLEAMKTDERYQHIPVIMISAVDEVESVVRCIEMGAEDYLPKPFNPTLLKARLGASLDKKRLRDQELAHLQLIDSERQRADDLLRVILPDTVVEELKATNAIKPRRHDNVAVMFCDIVEFTSYCDRREPEEVLAHLQGLVEIFEELTVSHGLEKIKTVGDAFMTTAGLLKPVENPVLSCVRCGLEMVAAAPNVPPQWQVRVGVHLGPVIAGVVGRRQYLFDVWGDTVNTAARVESLGLPNTVNVSGPAWKWVSNRCRTQGNRWVNVKGKGELEIYQVDGLI
jgi:CheY-like chemotaxis protein